MIFILLDWPRKSRGHKFGKIVHWLLFMLCPQAILALTMWKNFAIVCWRKTKRNQHCEKYLQSRTDWVQISCEPTIRETICLSISFSRRGMRLAPVWENLSAISVKDRHWNPIWLLWEGLALLSSHILLKLMSSYSAPSIQVWEF